MVSLWFPLSLPETPIWLRQGAEAPSEEEVQKFQLLQALGRERCSFEPAKTKKKQRKTSRYGSRESVGERDILLSVLLILSCVSWPSLSRSLDSHYFALQS